MSKTQRWEWAVGLKLEELDYKHLQSAYKLNWDNLCKFDSCRKNCKRILCLACFDRSWIDNDSANNSGYDNYDTTNCEQERTDLKSFVGLKNLGATCYVNCLLQLWFHNPALRKAIYEWDRNSKVDLPQDDMTARHKMIQDCNSSSDNDQSVKISNKRSREDEKLKLSPSKKIQKTSSGKQDSNHLTINQNNELNAPHPTSTQMPSPNNQKGASNSVQANPIEQLQLIFARMQFTNKKSIDPFSFIDSLALNAAEQQDAQEFGNLFMEFLEKSFANQNNSFVSNIIQNQFCGRYSYATICDHCKHNSLSDSTFYELDLSIQNLESLHDCLNEFFRPVPLDGKYNCSHCQRAQSAHRKIILKTLPPTLNLQLLRFVYDVQRGTRQKLNSYIMFPEVLDMSSYLKQSDSKSKINSIDLSIRNNNNDNNFSTYNGTPTRSQSNKSSVYILSAVLIHRGSSPHSGHYIAHIKDRITKDWYKFNDDSVERIGPQLQVSTEGENITIVDDKTESVKRNDSSSGKVAKLDSKCLKSKTAYMLVYQARDNEAFSYPSDHSEDWQLPEHLQTAVAEENSRSEELFESLQIAKEVDQQIIIARKNQIKSIYDKLVCRSPNDKFEFIDKTWLQNWLTNSSSTAKFKPIDNSDHLCMHDKLDFRKLDQVKCINSEGADLLYKEFGGGPRLQDAMCRACVELEVKLIQLKDRLKEEQKFITSQAKFKLDADYDFADAYIVGKNSYRDWQALVMVQFQKSNPELSKRQRDNSSSCHQQNSSDEDDHKGENQDSSKINEDQANSDSDDEAMEKFVFNSDILCEHNQLINDPTEWRIVPKEVWNIFSHYFGNDSNRPLIEHNANTLMCAECRKQEVEQQEIGDIQKQKAAEQKSKLPDLFHNRKRASWCSMLPGDTYFAIDRQFLVKWQKFIRNPCNQELPASIRNRDKLVCDHGKCLYNFSNSNPVLPESPFVLVSKEELKNLKLYFEVDQDIEFSIDPDLADEKLKLYLATFKYSGDTFVVELKNNGEAAAVSSTITNTIDQQKPDIKKESSKGNEDIDLTEIDWSECVISEPDFCSDCHEMLKQDELKKLLNYESATIYITKVDTNTLGSHTTPTSTNGGNVTNNENCDNDPSQATANKEVTLQASSADIMNLGQGECCESLEDQSLKRRKKIIVEDEACDFVPPGAAKQPPQTPTNSTSILRRTTRRNRNREQAYTIKPSQTLLHLKKEIFSRCQVLPVDQRLFLNDVLLDDNSKTMAELRIVPNCSLKLEVDRPISDNIDLIEDEPSSRKSCAQPETGFKGSLLLSNSHF